MGSYFSSQTDKEIIKSEINFEPIIDPILIDHFLNGSGLNISNLSGKNYSEKREEKIHNNCMSIISKFQEYKIKYYEILDSQNYEEFVDFLNEIEFEVKNNYKKLNSYSKENYRYYLEIQKDLFLSLQFVNTIINLNNLVLLKRVITISKSIY